MHRAQCISAQEWISLAMYSITRFIRSIIVNPLYEEKMLATRDQIHHLCWYYYHSFAEK